MSTARQPSSAPRVQAPRARRSGAALLAAVPMLLGLACRAEPEAEPEGGSTRREVGPEPRPGSTGGEVAALTSIELETTDPNAFDAGSKCRKSYEELFGTEDGVRLARGTSPCTLTLSLDRQGKATRVVDLLRYDKVQKQRRSVERTTSTASLSAARFDAVARTILDSAAFKDPRAVEVAIHTCKITVTHARGGKTLWGVMDPSATAFMPMIDAVLKLDRELDWADTR